MGVACLPIGRSAADRAQSRIRRGGLCGLAAWRAIPFFFFLLAKAQRRKGIERSFTNLSLLGSYFSHLATEVIASRGGLLAAWRLRAQNIFFTLAKAQRRKEIVVARYDFSATADWLCSFVASRDLFFSFFLLDKPSVAYGRRIFVQIVCKRKNASEITNPLKHEKSLEFLLRTIFLLPFSSKDATIMR